MGQMAEDCIAGACCAECMVYFQKAHGYPVLCRSCYDNHPAEAKRSGYQCATQKEL